MLRLGNIGKRGCLWATAAHVPLLICAPTWADVLTRWDMASESTLSPRVQAQNLQLDIVVATRSPVEDAWGEGDAIWARRTLAPDAEFGGPSPTASEPSAAAPVNDSPGASAPAKTASPQKSGGPMQWRRPQLVIADADGERDAISDASTAPLKLLAPHNAAPRAARDGDAPALELAARPLTIVRDDPANEETEPTSESVASDDDETWLTETEPPTDADPVDEAEPLRDDAIAADQSESTPARRLPVATRQLPPLSQTQVALRDKVRKVLKHYYQRPLNTRDRSPWEIMHWLLAYEVHSQVLQGGPDGKPITTVGWLCFNQDCKGRSLLYLNNDGNLRVRVGPALQGHHGQLLAMLAQARVKSDYPIRVEGREFAIEDLIAEEKLTCYPRTELTFKLIGLQQYLDIEETWINDQGMTWDFPTLIREEMRQPVRTAACGGTHRLSGLALAVKKRERSGLPVDGEYAKAKQFVANYQNYAYRLQNSDGSMSTEWFRGPGSDADLDRRLKTTGHTLEWLVYAANDKQLQYHRTVRAVNYLCNLLWAHRTRDWEAGPLGHAIHALVLYDRLAFAPYDQAPQGPVAGRASQRR